MIINHFVSVQLRVNGTGALQSRVLSLKEEYTRDLVDYTMSLTTSRPATILCNFKQTKAQFEFKTTEIDEVFQIDQMEIFIKPVATSYPG